MLGDDEDDASSAPSVDSGAAPNTGDTSPPSTDNSSDFSVDSGAEPDTACGFPPSTDSSSDQSEQNTTIIRARTPDDDPPLRTPDDSAPDNPDIPHDDDEREEEGE